MKTSLLALCFSLSTILSTAQSACNNEDFEASPAAVYTTSNGISGWTISLLSTPPSSVQNCYYNTATNLPNLAIGGFNLFEVHNSPGGFIDTVIGPQYPIYSVFGSGAPNNGSSFNPSISNMYGNNFIRVARHTGTNRICKLEKTISVTSLNSILDFAFINVAKDKDDLCCQQSAMIIKLFNASAGNTIIPSSTYSVSNSSSNCTNTTVSTFSYCIGNTVFKYHPWELRSINLSPYIGSSITIQLTVTGCQACSGLNFLYTYFDSQCRSDMTLGINSLVDKTNFKIYPNPTSGNFNIDIAKDIINGEIELRNILGQTVHKQNVKQGNNSIKTENLAKGIYNYSVLQNKEVVSVGKLVIE